MPKLSPCSSPLTFMPMVSTTSLDSIGSRCSRPLSISAGVSLRIPIRHVFPAGNTEMAPPSSSAVAALPRTFSPASHPSATTPILRITLMLFGAWNRTAAVTLPSISATSSRRLSPSHARSSFNLPPFVPPASKREETPGSKWHWKSRHRPHCCASSYRSTGPQHGITYSQLRALNSLLPKAYFANHEEVPTKLQNLAMPSTLLLLPLLKLIAFWEKKSTIPSSGIQAQASVFPPAVTTSSVP